MAAGTLDSWWERTLGMLHFTCIGHPECRAMCKGPTGPTRCPRSECRRPSDPRSPPRLAESVGPLRCQVAQTGGDRPGRLLGSRIDMFTISRSHVSEQLSGGRSISEPLAGKYASQSPHIYGHFTCLDQSGDPVQNRCALDVV